VKTHRVMPGNKINGERSSLLCYLATAKSETDGKRVCNNVHKSGIADNRPTKVINENKVSFAIIILYPTHTVHFAQFLM